MGEIRGERIEKDGRCLFGPPMVSETNKKNNQKMVQECFTIDTWHCQLTTFVVQVEERSQTLAVAECLSAVACQNRRVVLHPRRQLRPRAQRTQIEWALGFGQRRPIIATLFAVPVLILLLTAPMVSMMMPRCVFLGGGRQRKDLDRILQTVTVIFLAHLGFLVDGTVGLEQVWILAIMKRIQARFTFLVGARVLLKHTAGQGGLAVLFV